jgi:hypothetical protein
LFAAMRADNPLKHFAIAFVLAIICYVVAYGFIEHRRNRKGPWQVVFTNTPAGDPALVINQGALAIHNATIRFPGVSMPPPVTNQPEFSQPKQVPWDVPFGKCIFMDTTFLPGTLTFQMFGHDIELLPRVLVIDRQEHPWKSDEKIVLRRPDAPQSETDH